MKNLNSLNWFIVFFSLINLSVCIYEDQIGKFDWRQTYVGRIKFAQFDTVSTAKKIIVATEENVLAALNLKTGQVVWRHVFENASPGNIQLLHVTEKVVTVSGSNPYLVRGWSSATGVLLWEWSLTLQNEETAEFSEWWVQNGMLVHMLPVFGSHIEVTMYNLMTGHNRGATSKLPAQWSNDGCVVSPPYYTCISDSHLLISLDVTSNAVQVISQPLTDYITVHTDVNVRALDGNSIIPGFILDDKKIILLRDQFEVLETGLGDPGASVTVVDSATGPLLLQTWSNKTKGFTVSAHNVFSGAEVRELSASDRELHVPETEVSAALCARARDQHACRYLLTGADDATYLVQQGGRVLWSREEALANVVAVEFVDLPVSDLDAAIESEFDQKEGSIWSAFARRIHTQYQQLCALVGALQLPSTHTHDDTDNHALVRDYFNLHKIIVLVTEAGKIFGMDNLSGEILWRTYEPNLDTEGLQVFTRRTARHPPHDAYLTIVGKHEETGNAVIISLNPITGAPVGENTLHLDVRPLQVAMLHIPDAQKLHAIILLDSKENVQIFPESAGPLIENMFMYVADKNTGNVRGYAIRYDGEGVSARLTWSVSLGGRIVSVSGRPARLHSAGRVLPDRSVLYKYNNPNLVLFLVHAYDNQHKDTTVSACVDVVSGAVVCGAAHRRARPAPLTVHVENAAAYVLINDKQRRTEITTLELYEGKQRWSSPGASFSSLSGGGGAPSVARTAYILPAPLAAAHTRTARGITDKHVLFALTTGAVIEMPWLYLDPRRPGGGAVSAGAEREEGVVGYAPELPCPAEAVVNYNRSLVRVRAIHTAPAGLESTSLVLVTGLDLFYTRVAPSKTFDLLKDDFDYYLITIVLAALIVATYSTKYFASRKMLKMAWK